MAAQRASGGPELVPASQAHRQEIRHEQTARARPSADGPEHRPAILAEVTRIRAELTAFFGCLYYAV